MLNNKIAYKFRRRFSTRGWTAGRTPPALTSFARTLNRGASVFAGFTKTSSIVAAFCVASVCWNGAAHAQDTSVGFQATREALAQRRAQAEGEIASGKLNASRKRAAQAEVASITARLDSGDFHPGDLLVVTVTIVLLDNRLTVDTSTVRANQMISITGVPDMSVKGVLRSEVQDKVKAHIEMYIKQPKVRVNFTTRVTITGAVGRPGTYPVSPDRQLTELVGLAGGGTQLAKLDQMEIRRGGRVILSTDDSKRALIAGRTLDQVGVQPGDEVVIPAKRAFNWQGFAQIALLISSLTFALIQFMTYYYSQG